ncbi:TetR/AcrR family transcriptional regulator [Luteipulveratus flavus]|uniref:Helix-turn-helix domain containing protein n=1 Tax=Luteipulveratus flavus TaxID=3031728 RepID=A0ABT6C5Z5_9MICO|nr:TetR/AcrR family transcriptional regulator [Luteipulveratus sp. YIM 133296]MDF8264364.1 helix-turn-helix domain containing protein [Luteipulveratus sp. YIM 133296]
MSRTGAGTSLLGPPPGSGRRDAQRNTARVLDAAALLITRCGPDALTMDAVAAQAGVGKGTVFRRFGNRAGLMAALMDHTERELQERFMSGPPPLGPGAPPLERLLAFGEARLHLVAAQGPIMRAIGDLDSRFEVPAHGLALTHVRLLLQALETGGDVELLASALMAPLDPALVSLQVQHGVSMDRITAAWQDLVRRVVGSRR